MQYHKRGPARKPGHPKITLVTETGLWARPHLSTSQRVYLAIRDQIVRCTLAEHARLIEADLARELKVSRTPVRDALAQLARDGFVVTARGSRRVELVVAPLSGDEVEELWSLIAGVEAAAIGRIGLLGARGCAALADQLAEVNTRLRRLLTTSSADTEYVDLQAAFHESLVRDAGGPRIRAAHEAIRPHVARYEHMRARLAGRASPASMTEHDHIIRAIRDGNVDEARRAVVRHWLNAAKRTARIINDRDRAIAL
jgi:GntR family transcriptional regulator, rspAB operon transcriptional repressor